MLETKQPFVISLLNQKGGSGKTTIAINLARAFQLLGYTVTYIDSDTQGSGRTWKLVNSGNFFPVVTIDKPTIHESLHIVTTNIVIVDGLPAVEEMSTSAIMASDLVLIPVQPSPLDLWATNQLVNLVKAGMQINPELKASFVISRLVLNTKIGNSVNDILKEYKLPVLDTAIPQSVDYSHSLMEGNTIFEYANSKSKSYRSMLSLAEEIVTKHFPDEIKVPLA